MKVVLLGCAFLFSQIGLSQMHYPSSVTLHDYELKGPVKELIFDDNCPDTNDISYGGMYTNSPTDLGCHAILSFNKFGYLTQKSIKRHGNWISQTQFTFLQDSILTSLKGNEGFPHDEILFKYNDAGEILTIEIMYQSKLYAIYRFDRNQEARTLLISHLLIDEKKTIIIEKELQEFDSNLNLLSSKKFKGKSETPHFVRTFTYNNSNQVTSESSWRMQPPITKKDPPQIDYWQICYMYNNSGNVIEETEYIGIEKQIYTQTKYFYNQYHSVAERRDTNFMYSRQSIISYEYDTLKQLKLETHTSNGRLVRYFMYDYDVLGNRILEIEEKSAPLWSNEKVIQTYIWHVTTRNQYEYDHYGNWTKKYYLDWYGNEKIATRTIRYWE